MVAGGGQVVPAPRVWQLRSRRIATPHPFIPGYPPPTDFALTEIWP